MDDLSRRLRRRADRWLDRIAPRGCALCGETLPAGAFPGVCTGCLLELPGARRPRCARCAHPTDRPAPACTACATDEPVPPLDRTVTAADYAPPLDRVVAALKFDGRLALARPLGELLACAWRGLPADEPLDCLVPVPLGARRLARRGFNQSLEIARALARSVPAPPALRPGALVRLRETPPQSSLGLAERRGNLAGCFAAPRPLAGLRVGLVDDVTTSGTTLVEAARALRAAGAARVVALVAARTP